MTKQWMKSCCTSKNRQVRVLFFILIIIFLSQTLPCFLASISWISSSRERWFPFLIALNPSGPSESPFVFTTFTQTFPSSLPLQKSKGDWPLWKATGHSARQVRQSNVNMELCTFSESLLLQNIHFKPREGKKTLVKIQRPKHIHGLSGMHMEDSLQCCSSEVKGKSEARSWWNTRCESWEGERQK